MDTTDATLPRAEDIEIDLTLPVAERRESFLRQMGGNPYRFTSCGVPVTVSFKGECTLEEAVGHYLAMQELAAEQELGPGAA